MKSGTFDATGLATRLRRLSQLMLTDVDLAYAADGLDFRTRLFPVVFALHREGVLNVGELASISGFTQPAVSQTVRQLETAGLVSVSPGRDARSRQIALTDAGQARVNELLPFWEKARRAVEQLLAEAAPDFLATLDSLEAALERRSLLERIKGGDPATSSWAAVELLPFSVAYRAAFRDLNREWVETFFQLEPYDIEQLEHPERILEQGGEIWFARLEGEVVGTGALYCHGEGEYEVAKMAVTPRVQGRGVGRRLLEQLIRRFKDRGGHRLRLETNARLASAIALYRSAGFVDHPPPRPSKYARANVFMEWQG